MEVHRQRALVTAKQSNQILNYVLIEILATDLQMEASLKLLFQRFPVQRRQSVYEKLHGPEHRQAVRARAMLEVAERRKQATI